MRPARSELAGMVKDDGPSDPAVFQVVATTDRFDHCVFTVRDGSIPPPNPAGSTALFSDELHNPAHRE